MIKLEIPLEPVPWAAHRGYGKKSFNPRYKEREAFQWYIRQQYKDKPLEGAVSVFYGFYFSIPQSYSKKMKQDILDKTIMHTKKPDVSNCMKFTEDCLKGIVIIDDNQVWDCSGCKYYGQEPKVNIFITEYFTDGQGKQESEEIHTEKDA